MTELQSDLVHVVPPPWVVQAPLGGRTRSHKLRSYTRKPPEKKGRPIIFNPFSKASGRCHFNTDFGQTWPFGCAGRDSPPLKIRKPGGDPRSGAHQRPLQNTPPRRLRHDVAASDMRQVSLFCAEAEIADAARKWMHIGNPCWPWRQAAALKESLAEAI